MPPPGLAWAYGVLAVVLVASAVTDVRSGKVYNIVTYPAAAAGLIGHTLAGGLAGDGGRTTLGLLGALAGLAVGFVPMLLAWWAGGIGGGDAKLMGAVGALTGWRFALAAMFFGFVTAGIMAVVVMVVRRRTRATFGRIWRFLYLTLTPAGPADPAAPDSPKIPFGAALCVGSAAALVEVLLRGPVAQKLFLPV